MLERRALELRNIERRALKVRTIKRRALELREIQRRAPELRALFWFGKDHNTVELCAPQICVVEQCILEVRRS